ncbi:type II secretion system protein, partial [candidate division WOR-3 bacterium]|nr:type II secretion system protein [candidate division WOR-3 bacterium]
MKKKAFTLIELLIVVVVFSIIMASVLGVYINSQRAKYRIDMMTEAQQAARTALDFMIKDIRAAGYNIDLEEDATSNPQRRIVYAGPYELIFNANIRPVNDNPENPIAPQAMDHTLNTPVHYSPSKKYETGAETIVYTLDYNNTDGIINTTDRGATESAFTPNPNDYALVKRVYGYDAATTSNGGANQIVSIVGGPDQFPSQTSGTPMFLYWY